MSLYDIELQYEEDPAFEHMRNIRVNGLLAPVSYVPGIGSITPKVMLVGEAPGQHENYYRKPFCGPSGFLLKKLMKLAGLSLENSYLTNVVKYRPLDKRLNNRSPRISEIEASKPYITEEWEALNRPAIIIAVGAVAYRALDPAATLGILQVAGHWRQWSGSCTIIPMVHPSYILRNEAQLPKFKEDWKALGDQLRDRGHL